MYVHRRRKRLEIWTPAKLNLFLEVSSRRSDGYHEIETLMVPISLFDTLRFLPRDDDRVVLQANWAPGLLSATDGPRNSSVEPADASLGDLPQGEENLVVRAIERLRERADVSHGISIELIKRIPSSAGLGGGSSDAAAALAGANILWGLGWSRRQLAALASELGSDIPFFLENSASLCRGRGEQVEPLTVEGPLHFVVFRPLQGLSTAAVYRETVVPSAPKSVLMPRRAALNQGHGLPLFNRLQETAERMAPWVREIRHEFDRWPVRGHQMSGSGSAYFAVCHNALQAQSVAARVRSRMSGRVFCTRMVGRGPQAFNQASQN